MTKRTKFALFLILAIIPIIAVSFYINKVAEEHKGWYNLYIRVLCKSGIARRMIQSDCGINPEKDSPEKIVLALRDFVFRTTKKDSLAPTILYEPSHRYFFAHSTPPVLQVCGGSAQEFGFLLSELGIPNRLIQHYAASFFKGNKGDTHVATEVFINNKWVFMDPTFNCHWNCSDGSKMLSLQEIHACIKNGHDLLVQEGPSKIPGYGIQEYYLNFKDLIYAYQEAGMDGKLGDLQIFE